jgi:hypothetical protein
MTRQTETRTSPGPTVPYDIQALALAVGILGVIAILCLVATLWPEAI